MNLPSLDLSSRTTKAAPTQHDRLVAQTRTWVAQTFFGTLLKQMADGPFKSELLSGGRGGQAFSSLYHQQLADRMARGAGDKLVNSIVRRIEASAAYQKQQQGQAGRAVPPSPPTAGGVGARNGSRQTSTRRHVPAAARA